VSVSRCFWHFFDNCCDKRLGASNHKNDTLEPLGKTGFGLPSNTDPPTAPALNDPNSTKAPPPSSEAQKALFEFPRCHNPPDGGWVAISVRLTLKLSDFSEMSFFAPQEAARLFEAAERIINPPRTLPKPMKRFRQKNLVALLGTRLFSTPETITTTPWPKIFKTACGPTFAKVHSPVGASAIESEVVRKISLEEIPAAQRSLFFDRLRLSGGSVKDAAGLCVFVADGKKKTPRPEASLASQAGEARSPLSFFPHVLPRDRVAWQPRRRQRRPRTIQPVATIFFRKPIKLWEQGPLGEGCVSRTIANRLSPPPASSQIARRRLCVCAKR